MSHRALIPADEVAATYDADSKILALTAKGFIADNVDPDSISFDRQPWLGGLYYKVMATYGPPPGKGLKPYEYTHKEVIPNLHVVLPSNNVLVQTEFWKGPITVIWLLQGKQVHIDAAASSADLSDIPKETTQAGKNIWVPVGEEFQIKQAVPQGSPPGNHGKVSLGFYDKSILELTGVSYETPFTMVFTFKALKVGETNVQMTVSVAPPNLGTYLVNTPVTVIDL